MSLNNQSLCPTTAQLHLSDNSDDASNMATPRQSTIQIGGNRHPNAADWSPAGTLAFGANRTIALWNPNVTFAFSQCAA